MTDAPHMRLVATWRLQDARAAGEQVIHCLRDAEADFFAIRADTAVQEPPRFGSRDGLLYLRGFGAENPTFRAGYTNNRLVLMIDFPNLRAWRQRRVGLLRWDIFETADHDREQSLYERAWRAISDAGLNPYEAAIQWEVAVDGTAPIAPDGPR